MIKYHCIEKVYAMNRKADFSIYETTYFKIKPALRITLIWSSLCITSSPNAVMVICIFDYLMHISRIKVTVEKYVGFSWLWKFKARVLRNDVWIIINRYILAVFLHQSNCINKILCICFILNLLINRNISTPSFIHFYYRYLMPY